MTKCDNDTIAIINDFNIGQSWNEARVRVNPIQPSTCDGCVAYIIVSTSVDVSKP